MKQSKRFFLSGLLLLLCTMMYAQEAITGTVSDAMGPVIGATVMEKGTANGTVTDFDGDEPGDRFLFHRKNRFSKKRFHLSRICRNPSK